VPAVLGKACAPLTAPFFCGDALDKGKKKDYVKRYVMLSQSVSKVGNGRHLLTREERCRGGRAGFRAAVLKVQIEHGLEFNEAVCWLKRKIGWVKGGK